MKVNITGNAELMKNKWGVIEIEKHIKPSARNKSIMRGSNYEVKPNKGKLIGKSEKHPEREPPDDPRKSSRSESAKGKGYLNQVTEEVSEYF